MTKTVNSTNSTNSTKIPTSDDLSAIVKAMGNYNKELPNLVTTIGEMAKNIKGFSKINIKEFKANTKLSHELITCVGDFMKNLSAAFNSLLNLTNDIDLSKYNKVRDILISQETTQNPEGLVSKTDKDGNSMEFLKVTKPGLLDIFNQVAGMGATMNSMVFVEPITFNWKFNQTLKLFKKQYNKLQAFAESLDETTVTKLKHSVDGLQEVMMFLPATVSGMTDMFINYGSRKKKRLIDRGIKALLGEDMNGTGGVVWSMLLLGDQLNSSKINAGNIELFKKSIVPLDKALRSIMLTVSLAAIMGPLLKLGLIVLFGRKGKGGVINLMINGLTSISERTKDIQNASKTLLYIAATIGILALSATAIVLTGILLATGWDAVLMTTAFMAVVVGMFMLIGWASGWIHDGGEELFYIAATVGILSLTALLIVFTGQFLEANWEAIGITLAVMAGLVGIFALVALASRLIEKGGKELFYIAATVGILAVIAVLLVYAGNLVTANWDSLKAIFLMLLGITGMLLAVALVGKLVEKSKVAFIAILGAVLIMGIVVAIFTKCAEKINEIGGAGKVWNVIGMVGAIIVGLAGIAIGLGFLSTTPAGAALWTGIGMMAAIVGMVTLIAVSMNMMVNAALKIQELKMDKDELLNKMKVPIDVAYELIKIVAKAPVAGVANFRRLARIVKYVGNMADVMQHIATLSIPIKYDKNGNPTAYRSMDKQDFINAAANSAALLQFFTAVFNDKETTLPNGVKVGGALDGLEKITRKIRRRVKRLGKIVGYVGGMADAVQKVALLRIPTGFDKNGKPTGYKQMGDTEFETAAGNVAKLMTTIIGAVSSDEVAEQLKSLSRKAAKNFETVMGAMSGVTGLMDIIQTAAGGQIATKYILDKDGNLIPDPSSYKSIDKLLKEDGETIRTNIKGMFEIVIGACAPYNHGELEGKLHDAEDEIENIQVVVSGASECISTIVDTYNNHLKDTNLDDLQSSYSTASTVLSALVENLGGSKVNKSNAKLIKENIKETNNLITKVNSVNIEKLKTASDLMKHISELSKSINGNFKDLAKVINEELLDALNKLTGALDKAGTMETPKSTPVASDIVSKPSGSAGVKDTKTNNTNQPQSRITPTDIENVRKAVADLTAKIAWITDNTKKAVRTVEA